MPLRHRFQAPASHTLYRPNRVTRGAGDGGRQAGLQADRQAHAQVQARAIASTSCCRGRRAGDGALPARRPPSNVAGRGPAAGAWQRPAWQDCARRRRKAREMVFRGGLVAKRFQAAVDARWGPPLRHSARSPGASAQSSGCQCVSRHGVTEGAPAAAGGARSTGTPAGRGWALVGTGRATRLVLVVFAAGCACLPVWGRGARAPLV